MKIKKSVSLILCNLEFAGLQNTVKNFGEAKLVSENLSVNLSSEPIVLLENDL